MLRYTRSYYTKWYPVQAETSQLFFTPLQADLDCTQSHGPQTLYFGTKAILFGTLCRSRCPILGQMPLFWVLCRCSCRENLLVQAISASIQSWGSSRVGSMGSHTAQTRPGLCKEHRGPPRFWDGPPSILAPTFSSFLEFSSEEFSSSHERMLSVISCSTCPKQNPPGFKLLSSCVAIIAPE